MQICPTPWSAPQDVNLLTGVPLRPIACVSGKRPPRIGGFRDQARLVSGDSFSFELPRPLTTKVKHQAYLDGTQLNLAIGLDGVADEDCPGVVIASRAAAIAGWLGDPRIHPGGSCEVIRKKLLDELESDEPPESLIVEVSRRHRFHLQAVCSDPRVQLRRRRELQLIDRVRQMDAASLRWLSRQPGRTVAERAGPRERILAVRRFRSHDTLENQVLIDVLRRSVALGTAYIRLYRRYSDSPRVAAVREMQRVFSAILSEEWVQMVRPLATVPTPNYALLSDRRYAPVWRLWQRLLRQEQLFQSLEAWLPRLVAELAWVGALAQFEGHSSVRPAHGRFPILQFRPEFDCADFVFGHQSLPPLVLRRTGGTVRIDLVRGDQLLPNTMSPGGDGPLWTSITSLRPDFAFVARSSSTGAVVAFTPVWCVATWNESDRRSLAAAMAEMPSRIGAVCGSVLERVARPTVIHFCAAGTASGLAVPHGIHIHDASSASSLLDDFPQMVCEHLMEACSVA